MNSRAEQFFKNVLLESSRAQYPEDVVFLCGGTLSNTTGTYASLRDAIYQNKNLLFTDSQTLLAEKAAGAFDAKIYENLLQFEKDIASISTLILLVSESAGSIAELGAFSQIPEINSKLLVFMHSQHYGESSFIKDGPVRYLEKLNEQSVQEFEWSNDVSGNIEQASFDNLRNPMKRAAESFYKKQPKTQLFNNKRIGHKILLIAGIVNMLGCCKLREIVTAAKTLQLNVSETEVKQWLFCLRLFGWVKMIKRDTNYYLYTATNSPFLFRAPKDFDLIRARFDILNNYPKNDLRLSVIDSVMR